MALPQPAIVRHDPPARTLGADGALSHVSYQGVSADLMSGNWVSIRLRRKADGEIITIPSTAFDATVTENDNGTWDITLTHRSLAGFRALFHGYVDATLGDIKTRPRVEMGTALDDFACHSVDFKMRPSRMGVDGTEYLFWPRQGGRVRKEPRNRVGEALATTDGEDILTTDGQPIMLSESAEEAVGYPSTIFTDGDPPQGSAFHQWMYLWNQDRRHGLLIRTSDLVCRGKRFTYRPLGKDGLEITARFYAPDNVKGDLRTIQWDYEIAVRPMSGELYDAETAMAWLYQKERFYPFRRPKLRDRTDAERGRFTRDTRLILWTQPRTPTGWTRVPKILQQAHAFFTDAERDAFSLLAYDWHANEFDKDWADAFPVAAERVAALVGAGGANDYAHVGLYTLMTMAPPTSTSYTALGWAMNVMKDLNDIEVMNLAPTGQIWHRAHLRSKTFRAAIIAHWKSGIDTAFGQAVIAAYYLDTLGSFGPQGDHSSTIPQERGAGGGYWIRAMRDFCDELVEALQADDPSVGITGEFVCEYLMDKLQMISAPTYDVWSPNPAELDEINVPTVPAMYSQYVEMNDFQAQLRVPYQEGFVPGLSWVAASAIFHWGKIPTLFHDVELRSLIPEAGSAETYLDEPLRTTDGTPILTTEGEQILLTNGWFTWGESFMRDWIDTLFFKAWPWVKAYMRLGRRLRPLYGSAERAHIENEGPGLVIGVDPNTGIPLLEPSATTPRVDGSVWIRDDLGRMLVALTNWDPDAPRTFPLRMVGSDYPWLRGEHTVAEADLATKTESAHAVVANRWEEDILLPPRSLRLFVIDRCPQEEWLDFGPVPEGNALLTTQGSPILTVEGEEILIP